MENIQKIQKYGSLENFALDQTEEFLRPKTPLDYIFTLALIFWCIIAVTFTGDSAIRATLFGIILLLFLVIPFSKFFSGDERDIPSPLNRAVKILFGFILINIFSSASISFELWDVNFPNLSYSEFESLTACLLTPLAIIWNRFNLKSMHFGYFYYVGEVFRGFWIATIVIFVLTGFSILLIPESFEFELEVLLLGSLVFNVLGIILPGNAPRQSVSINTLLRQNFALKNRVERVRDGFLSSAFILLAFLLLGWIVNRKEVIQYVAFFLLIIGVLLLLTPQRKRTNGFNSMLNSLTGKIVDPNSQVGSRINEFASTIQETSFEKPAQVFTIPTDDLKIISKGKTSISAKKGSMAVPTVTDKGTTLVLMGKSELSTKTEDQEVSTKDVEGTTTIWVPPEEWDELKLQLEPKKISELTENELISAGLDSTTELFDNVKQAISQLKNWKGPQGIFSSVFDTAPSKYTITETKDYTLVRLPGIFVFEKFGINLVQILGGVVQVVEIKGVGEYVKILGGLVTVLETPDYSFVQTPFVSVLETPAGEIVKIFGMRIQEGEKIDLDEARKEIMMAQEKFDRLFTNQVESLFSGELPNLLLTNSEGKQEGFLIGDSEYLSDQDVHTKRKSKKEEKKSSPSQKVIGPKVFTKTINITSQAKQEKAEKQEDQPIEYHYDEEGIPTNHPELLTLDGDIAQIEDSLEKADQKFLNDEVSDLKHEEIVKRLELKKSRLIMKREKLVEQIRLKFMD
ncbi:MAG: hypothetical protein ACW97Z_00370 [Candidatus Hodarchaeales archaeon]|jgi:hypothetical protein